MLQIPPGDWVLQTLQEPSAEPITLTQAKQHLRVPDDLTEFDDLITEYMLSARDFIERTYGLPIMPQKVRLSLAQFPRADRVRLPVWPVQRVDAGRYYTIDGVAHPFTFGDSSTQPVPDLLLRLSRKPAEIVVPWAHIWPPAVLQTADAVQFDLTVGFVRGDSPETLPVPAVVLQALRLLIGHMYDIGAAVTVIGRPSEPLVLGLDAMMTNVRLWA